MHSSISQDYDWRQYASNDDNSSAEESLRTRLATQHLKSSPCSSPHTAAPDSASYEDTLSGSMVCYIK